MKIADIQTIELEITSNCNAKCPQCVRNYYGSNTWNTLPVVDMSLDEFKNNMPDDIWKTLKHIKFCGTYGDPLMNKDLIKFVDYVKEQNNNIAISINTNGGIRSIKWWKELAEHLGPEDLVFFGIDGLEDTNHLYRIDVNFNKVIKNLTAFNKAGGRSIWSYIVFEHNDHQVEEARDLSKTLGCLDFKVKSTNRFVDKTHTIVDKSPVMNTEHEIIRWIKPTKGKYRNKGYDGINSLIKEHGSWQNYLETATIDCFAQREGFTYIAANGEVYQCGWLSDRMYGFEPEKHQDHQVMLDMIEELGGRDKINLFKTPLKEIVEETWFPRIEQSWKTNEIQRCANQCGELYHLLTKEANKDLEDVYIG